MKNKIAWLLNLEEQYGHLIPNPHKGIGRQLKQRLEEMGLEVKMSNDASNLGEFAVLIAGDADPERLEQMRNYPRDRCCLIATEPVAVIPLFHHPLASSRFGKIFTLLQNYVDNQNYFKIHHIIEQKYVVQKGEEWPFERKKLCCMIQGNKMGHQIPGELYTERKNLALSFTYMIATNGEVFDLYGPWWDGVKSWKGVAATGKSVLKEYKFAICYENTSDQPGYITERIFHSLLTRNVPVYLGAPDILDYVPKECFIDARDFGGKGVETHRKIWRFMASMDKATYEKYVEAGQDYINNNPKFKLFSVESIVNTVMNQVKKIV